MYYQAHEGYSPEVHWHWHAPHAVTFKSTTLCPHSVFICSIWF